MHLRAALARTCAMRVRRAALEGAARSATSRATSLPWRVRITPSPASARFTRSVSFAFASLTLICMWSLRPRAPIGCRKWTNFFPLQVYRPARPAASLASPAGVEPASSCAAR